MNPFKAIIGIKRTYVNGQYVGSRLRAAIPNDAGYKFKPYTDKRTKERKFAIKESLVTSFRAPYLICEASDLVHLTTDDVQRFLTQLELIGYKEFNFEKEVLEIAHSEFSLGS